VAADADDYDIMIMTDDDELMMMLVVACIQCTVHRRHCRPSHHPSTQTYVRRPLVFTVWDSRIRFTARRYASAVLAVDVCLSVSPSAVTRRYCVKTARRRIVETTPHDSPGTNFLAEDFGEIRTGSTQRGRQMQVVSFLHFALPLVSWKGRGHGYVTSLNLGK